MSIDLHCHTLFSPDARGTPEELVDIAAERELSALAITEHNHIGSLERARKRAAVHGIRLLPGVEINATWKDADYHFLAYGFDPEVRPLQELIDRNFAIFERHGWLFLRLLQEEGYALDRADVLAELPARYPTHPAPVLNNWHLREICLARGYLPDKEAYLTLQKRLKDELVSREGPEVLGRFAGFEETRDAVREAGGILLLAHVGQYNPGDWEAQSRVLSELLENGLDGFELYHPTNLAEPHFTSLAAFAQERDCAISGGSDCHHAAGTLGHPLGSAEVPERILETLDRALAQRA